MKQVQLFWMNGPSAGQQLEIDAEGATIFGRDESAKVAVEFDAMMSRRHFEIGCADGEWTVTDLKSSNGTYVNQVRVQQQALQDGDVISAGTTHWRVRDAANVTPFEFVIETLRSGPGLLFAVLDAARDPEILPLLENSGEQYQSLYEGAKGKELEEVAPYLVQFSGQTPLLNSLVYAGWGKAWGIYVYAPSSFVDVRRQLRRSLMMESDATPPRKIYLRYYDPRVFKIWVPTCTAQELGDFFGPIQMVSTEGEKPELVMRYQRSVEGLVKTEMCKGKPPKSTPAGLPAEKIVTRAY